MPKLQIIIGSTRPDRAADLVAPWVIERAKRHGGFEVEVLDLREWPLPMFAETFATVGDFNDPTYSEPIVRAWNLKIREGDAYLVITPEYNHSVPAVLKNAIDSVFVSFAFRNKPILAIGYSGGFGGGIRAIEHLVQIAVEAEMVPIRTVTIFPQVHEAFDEGTPLSPMPELSLRIGLDDLKWWSEMLATARARGQLPPAAFRIRAAVLDELEGESV
jgi:NAD(P)H-dependent FMN reductase